MESFRTFSSLELVRANACNRYVSIMHSSGMRHHQNLLMAKSHPAGMQICYTIFAGISLRLCTISLRSFRITFAVYLPTHIKSLRDFFQSLLNIHRDNLYFISKKISRSGLGGSLLLYGGGKIWVIRLKVPYHALSA